jgi:hypothetical protein
VPGVKHATFSKPAFAVAALLSLALVAACANSADVPAAEEAPTEPAPETKLPPASTTSTPPAKTCVPSCKTDSECTNSCPALAGGVQCCDLKTNTCWGSKTSSCPKPADTSDAGDAPLY